VKSTIAILAALVTLAVAAPALAQDWVMDWTSHGSSVGILTGPFAEGWTISGSSPTTLTPLPGGLPSDQSAIWSAPVPCAGIFSANCKITDSAFGDFAFTDANHFTLDVLVGTGHSHTELVGVGSRAGVTASTPEPATMAFGSIGLLGAALLRRRRQTP
jgi:MYXO-CTERM domain-containing protein